MMKFFWFCCAVLGPGKSLQSWIPYNPSTFCGSLFDIRYSAQLAIVRIEEEEQGADFRLRVLAALKEERPENTSDKAPGSDRRT